MSTLNVDKVDPNTGTALEIGSSGDTITIPSGATIVNSGTATGFGAVLTGSTNNTVTTVTAANAISGEANLQFDGTDLTVSTGNVVIGTAGKGIDFSAQTPAAGMTAELLDHYEEGTWTPDYQGSSGSAGSSSTTGTGYYTKIGQMVYINVKCRWSDVGSWTDNANLTGLPFTSNSNNRGAMTFGMVELIDFKGGSFITAEIAGSATQLTFREVNDDAAPTALVIGAFDNGSNDIIIGGAYRAT